MANPPPPYANITGISRTVMKDNAQETLANYNGNARPGEIVADLTTDPPALYIGNNLGQLTAIAGGGGGYGNTQVAQYLAGGLVGNIIPAGNSTYSLGNSTNWWSNVWLAGNTLYLGGVPLGMTGNTLTVNGSPVSGGLPLANGTSNIDIATANGNVTITTAGTETWSFDDTGNLDLPTNGSIIVDGGDGVIGPVSDDMVISWDNEEIRLVSVQGSIEMQADSAFRVQTNYDGGNDLYAGRWEFSNNELVNITNNFGIVSEAGNLLLSGGRDGVNSGNTLIRSVDVGVAVYDWTFDNTGVITLPNGGEIDNDGNNIELRSSNNINFEASSDLNIYTDDGNSQWTFGSGNTLTLPGGTAVIDSSDDNIELRSNNNINLEAFSVVNVYTDSGNFQYQFGDDGGFYVPNNGALIGTTANNNGYINWVGNSSGDGNGFTTMQLVPDATVDSQVLVLDPTSPGHIHLRAPGIGGNIEQPTANIFLGAEDTNFEITAQYANAAEARIHSAGNTWTFANDGNLNLPSQGNIVGITANNAGHLQWLGNSSGDGAGYTTLQLVPDDTLTGGDQYLIIDPTAPGHIHIRAGGTQDASNADLFLGGEYSYLKVAAGANSDVVVRSNSNEWTFDSTGNLTIPGSSGGLIKTVANAAIGIVAMDNGTDNPAQLMSWNVFQPNPSTIISAYANSATIMTDVNGTPKTWTFDNTGNLSAPGNISSQTTITTPLDFANLAPVAGGRAFLNDANLTAGANFGANVSGGGSNTVPVWSDGVNWYIG